MGINSVRNIFLKMRRTQSQVDNHIVSTSGDPQSHPGVTPEPGSSKVGLEYSALFVCQDAVNATSLLRRARSMVIQAAESFGGNAVVDEQ
jgi:hypothetical protein